jgi:hypothetical protein
MRAGSRTNPTFSHKPAQRKTYAPTAVGVELGAAAHAHASITDVDALSEAPT